MSTLLNYALRLGNVQIQDFIIIYILTSECHIAYLCLVQTT